MLPHLLIVLLTDGVGVKLWKSKEIQCCVKQTSMMKMSQIKPNLLGKKYLWRRWELAGVKLIFFYPLLQSIHVLIIIVPLKLRQKLSENVVFLHSSHFRLEQTFAHLFGEPIMPGVICRHWGVFTSGKRADIGVKGSRSDTAKSSSSSEHKEGSCMSRHGQEEWLVVV